MDGVGERNDGRGESGANGEAGKDAKTTLWQEELTKRLSALKAGYRYQISLTVGYNGNCDWTVDEGQKVERPKQMK